jgi:Uma2 family endonuclease
MVARKQTASTDESLVTEASREASSTESALAEWSPTPWRFTVDDYHRMGVTGILHEDDRVELVDGEVLLMAPISDPHMGGVIRLTDLFTQRLGTRVLLSVQNAIRLSPRSEPQPDIALLRRRPDFYTTGKPTPADVYLLIEVSDSTLRYDRDEKVPLYARAGIPELWLLDLQNDRLRVYRDPDNGEYRSVLVVLRGMTVAPFAFPDVTLMVDEVLGDQPAAQQPDAL